MLLDYATHYHRVCTLATHLERDIIYGCPRTRTVKLQIYRHPLSLSNTVEPRHISCHMTRVLRLMMQKVSTILSGSLVITKIIFTALCLS